MKRSVEYIKTDLSLNQGSQPSKQFQRWKKPPPIARPQRHHHQPPGPPKLGNGNDRWFSQQSQVKQTFVKIFLM